MPDTTIQTFETLKQKALSGANLTADDAQAAFMHILRGACESVDIAGFLVALKMRGETPDEIFGAASALRSQMTQIEAPRGAIDTCGTGGDGHGTYNVSTASAIVLAACGITVAKHGNRSVSSKSGSSDVLSALGVNLDQTPEQVAATLGELNIGFLFAPAHHSAMRHVAPVRAQLKTRTIFNVLGPLSNPAQVKLQLLGVYDEDLLQPMAQVLGQLGSTRAWVVHGADGLDELSVTGPSHVAALENGAIRRFTVTPQDAGLQTHSLADLLGGDAEQNAAAMRDMLSGATGAYRDAVLLNCAAGLVIAEKAKTLAAGAAQAAAAIDQGAALQTLERWAAFTQKGNA